MKISTFLCTFKRFLNFLGMQVPHLCVPMSPECAHVPQFVYRKGLSRSGRWALETVELMTASVGLGLRARDTQGEKTHRLIPGIKEGSRVLHG
jgi:hypothetical protein